MKLQWELKKEDEKNTIVSTAEKKPVIKKKGHSKVRVKKKLNEFINLFKEKNLKVKDLSSDEE